MSYSVCASIYQTSTVWVNYKNVHLFLTILNGGQSNAQHGFCSVSKMAPGILWPSEWRRAMPSHRWKVELPLSSFFIRPSDSIHKVLAFVTQSPPQSHTFQYWHVVNSVSTWILEGKQDSNSNNLSSLFQCIWVWSYRTAPLGIICEHVHHINLGTSYVLQMKIEGTCQTHTKVTIPLFPKDCMRGDWRLLAFLAQITKLLLCLYLLLSWKCPFTTPAIFLQA